MPIQYIQQAPKKRDRFAFQRGVTYAEILLALALFLTAATGITGSYLAVNDLAQHANKNMKAVSDAQTIMEHVQATPFQNVTTVFPAGVANGGGVTDYTSLVGGYTLSDEQITVTYPSQAANRLEIVVTVAWSYRGRARSTVFSTIRAS